jgi:4-amino-4-deoxy-L-arabinose transferase-like glycosyltransferase
MMTTVVERAEPEEKNTYRSAPAGRTQHHRTHMWLGLTVAAAAALRVYEFRGFGCADDAAYAQLANQVVNGTFIAGAYTGPATFPLRVGLIYPTAASFAALGVNEWSMVLFPFVVSMLSVVLAYLAAHAFFGPRAGLIAAGLWAVLPLDALHATLLVPDLAAAFFGSGAVVAVLLLERSSVHLRSVFAGGVAAGLLFGFSWLCRESVAYLVPFCVFLFLLDLRRNRVRSLTLWTGVAAGSLAILAGEMFVYHHVTGDWLFRLHETERSYRQYANGPASLVTGSGLLRDSGSHVEALFKRLVLTGPVTILLKAQFLYLPLLASVVAVWALYMRRREYLVLAVWFCSLALMFNFASGSLKEYVPLLLFDRYLYPLMLPAVVMVSGFLAALAERPPGDRGPSERRFWGTVVACVLLLVAAQKNAANRRWAPDWTADAKTVSRTLTPADKLYTDILTIHALEFFWEYPPRLNTVNFEEMNPAATPAPGEYVFVNRKYLGWLDEMAGWWPTKTQDYRPPAFAQKAPTSWERVWGSENATLYRVR